MLNYQTLDEMYNQKGMSMQQIANYYGCSLNRIAYWMKKNGVKRRTISDAIYARSNPSGDPFILKNIESLDDAYLAGLGIGLYWGEGNKRNKHSVRLGNTDPALIKLFVHFLIKICGVKCEKLRFAIQIFSDMEAEEALSFWKQYLGFDQSYFIKTVVTPARSIGTYKEKTRHGVLTVHFHNYKLRDIIVSLCRDSSVGRAHPWWTATVPPTHQEIGERIPNNG